MAGQSPDILHPSTSLEWEEWPSLPVGMSDAHVMCMNGTVFVGGGHTGRISRDDARLYSFRPGVDSTWTVTDTPTRAYALIEHESHLLLVGGYEYPSEELTNKVFSLKDGEFVETLPPMREKRYKSSAVSSGSELVVAGGWGTSGELSSVEVFRDGRWTTGPSLPTAGSGMKSALHGDMWYLMLQNGKVFCTSLHSLLSKEDQSPWETLPDTPNTDLACTLFSDHLLSIGGGEYRNTTSAIHAFSTSSQSWEHVADLPVSVSRSAAGVSPTGELIVVGGKNKRGNYSHKVFRIFIKVLLIDPDVHFSLPKLFQLHRYGVNLIEALSRDRYRFHVTAGVQLLKSDKQKALTVSAEGYIELIFKAWERRKRPTYPPTWEGLFTVLRKMDLGHLVEQIAKCVTGSVPEIEGSPQTSEPEGPAGEKVSRGEKELSTEQGLSVRESELPESPGQSCDEEEEETLEEANIRLNRVVAQQSGSIVRLKKENKDLRAENHQLRAKLIKEESMDPVARIKEEPGSSDDLRAEVRQLIAPHIKQGPTTFKDEPESGVDYQVSTSATLQPTAVKSEPQESLEDEPERLYTASLYYLNQSVRSTEIHLVVSLNLDTYIKDVQQHYVKKHAKEGSYLAVEFEGQKEEDKKIKLDIPRKGIVHKDWKIYPLVPPIITKQEVDSFNPGQRIPALQIKAKSTGDSQSSELIYTLRLVGAKQPKNQIVIEIETPRSVSPPSHSFLAPSSRQFSGAIVLAHREHWQERRLAPPTITELHQGTHHQQHNTLPSVVVKSEVSPYPVMPPPHHTGYYPPFFGPPPSHPPPSWSMQGLSGSGISGGVLMSMPEPSSLTQGPLSSPIEYPPVTFDELVEHVGVNKDLLNQECSDEHLREIAASLHNWLKYAELLGLKGHKIQDIIDSNKLLDSEMKAHKVLRLWKKANAFKATYSSLVKVCLSQRHSDVAKTICKLMKRSEDSSRPPPTGEKRRQEDEHTEEEQAPSKKPRPEM